MTLPLITLHILYLNRQEEQIAQMGMNSGDTDPDPNRTKVKRRKEMGQTVGQRRARHDSEENTQEKRKN
jgi:hypothetical protein